ncbi:MAG: S8 family serine peptidase, partial [Gammaproteobacteria bacterium]|nr:S8 family serine peptidase [Gammaproteobacteria bacterium]
ASIFGCSEQNIPLERSAKTLNRPIPYIKRINYDNAELAQGILVKYKNNVPSGARARSLQSAGLTATGNFALVPGLTRAEPLAGVSVTETLQALATDTSVAYAEPDFIVTTSLVPDDQQFSQQYALNNQQNPVADISAVEAWDLTTGSENVVVAVIDTGVDYNHQDLQANIWSNIDEIPNNRIDDDQNGYVDDIRGWNFSGSNNNPMDDNNHGTHVAGIIGAVGNNSNGVSGVNWNIKIMPLKFMNARGQGQTSAAINAIEYAVANGAKISNNSWGGGAYSQAMFDAIQAANSAGHLFVTAAGNDGLNNDNTPSYPANYNLSNIISVAATDSNDNLASFSNFGSRTVDIAAPGVAILSTVRNNQYREMSGTSMASPFVAGAAGLLLSRNSSLTTLDIRSSLLDNVDKISAASNTVSGGRLNLFTAVSNLSVAPAEPIPSNPQPQPPAVSIPTISSGLQELVVGSSAQLIANGGAQPYTWGVNNTSIATIDPANGTLMALSAGQIEVIVTDSAGTSSAPLNVNILAEVTPAPPVALDVTIVPNVQDVAIGASKQMTASGGIAPYTWAVDLLRYANIESSTGVFTALTVGQVNVTVTDSTGVSSAPYPVNIIPMQILPKAVTQMGVNETLTLTADGGVGPYSWEISDPAVANMTPTDLNERECVISPVTTGTFNVTMIDTTFNTATTSTISILEQPLVVSPLTLNLNIGENFQLNVTGGTSPYIFESMDDTIASVDGGGLIT